MPAIAYGPTLAWLFLAGLAVLLISGALSLAAGRDSGAATRRGVAGTLCGCTLAAVPVAASLAGARDIALSIPWSLPLASLSVGIDRLSAFFLVPILLLSALGAVYGSEYLKAYASRHRLGPPWAFYNTLVAAMALVVTARNGMLFLIAWEVMALASFFLVTLEDEKPEVRDAGWVYLVATHLGTACLLPFFLVLGKSAGSLDFDRLEALGPLPPAMAAVLFSLALVGFGAKAGFMPLHVWLPEAHPAAPSHVSAVMSGVMIKTGIYGLVRFLPMLGAPQAWWGWVLIGIGFTSGILGVLFALAQHDIKRLLAYHSVENIGIIALGLGVGMVGQATGSPIAYLGYAGALLHVLNHALFKGLLFLAAGSVAHATHTRDMDSLGGLQKAMPWTGTLFLVGCVAIVGLPPLNGFVSEFLIYLGAVNGLENAGPMVPVLGGLALIGGLAAACFAKAYGAVFLGLPRTHEADHAADPGRAMRHPMAILAGACFLIGLLAARVVEAIEPVVRQAVEAGLPASPRLPGGASDAEITGMLSGAALPGADALFAGALQTLSTVSALSGACLVLAGLLAFWRRRLLSGRPIDSAGTWDCGYAAPTARMQYTASSFAQPLVRLFGVVLQTRRHAPSLGWPYPREASFHTDTPDVFRLRLFAPLYAATRQGAAKLRWIQHGNLQLYVLYIALTILVLMVWKLG